MIEITGTYTNPKNNESKSFNEELLTAAQVIEMFDISFPGVKDWKNPTDFDRIFFRAVDKHIKFNKQNNFEDAFLGCSTITQISHQGKYGSFSLRYYTRKTPKANANGYDYRPHKLNIIRGKTTTMYLNERLEEIVWMILWPKCVSSPLKTNRHKDFIYDLYDDNRTRLQALEIYKKEASVIAEIMDMSVDMLRTKVAGMSIKGGSIGFNYSDAPDTIQAKVIEWLKKYPVEFINQWRNPKVNVKGFIMEAHKAGLFVEKKHGFDNAIHFTPEIYDGEKIATGAGDESLLDILYREAVNNWAAFKTKITNALADKKLAEKDIEEFDVKDLIDGERPEASTKHKDLQEYTPAQLVTILQDEDLIHFDRASGEVVKVKKNGDLGDLILKIEDPLKWKEELIQFYSDPEKKKSLINRIVAIQRTKKTDTVES